MKSLYQSAFFDKIDDFDTVLDTLSRFDKSATQILQAGRNDGVLKKADNLFAILKAYNIMTENVEKMYKLYKESKNIKVKNLMLDRFIRYGVRLLLDENVKIK